MWYLQFFQLWEWGFPACGSNCLLSILLMKWNRSHMNKIVIQSAYTSAIERSLLKRNGRDCNSSMHYTISFCHVTTFWKLIGTANFQVVEVTVWTHGSCQAIFPTAWDRHTVQSVLEIAMFTHVPHLDTCYVYTEHLIEAVQVWITSPACTLTVNYYSHFSRPWILPQIKYIHLLQRHTFLCDWIHTVYACLQWVYTPMNSLR